MIITNVHNIHSGYNQAYIYIWVSKLYSVLYIGMTNNSSGSIGRANGHFNRRGTFRKRFIENKGIGIENVNDLILLTFPLPKKREYTGLESSYRESVEYLVVKKLQLKRGLLMPIFDVVSWHDRTPKRLNNSEIKNISDQIVLEFEGVYPTL